MAQVISPETLSKLLSPPTEPGCHLTLIIPLDGVLSSLRKHEPAKATRLTIAEAILSVLGAETLRAKVIVERLRSRGLLPRGKAPEKTVGTVLGQREDLFERVSRGTYRARLGVTASATTRAAV